MDSVLNLNEIVPALNVTSYPEALDCYEARGREGADLKEKLEP